MYLALHERGSAVQRGVVCERKRARKAETGEKETDMSATCINWRERKPRSQRK